VDIGTLGVAYQLIFSSSQVQNPRVFGFQIKQSHPTEEEGEATRHVDYCAENVLSSSRLDRNHLLGIVQTLRPKCPSDASYAILEKRIGDEARDLHIFDRHGGFASPVVHEFHR